MEQVDRKAEERRLREVVYNNRAEPGLKALKKLLEDQRQRQLKTLLQCLPSEMVEQRALVNATDKLLGMLEEKDVLPS